MAVAALLRFPTLKTQSYWFDEIVTVGLVNLSPGEMLSTTRNGLTAASAAASSPARRG